MPCTSENRLVSALLTCAKGGLTSAFSWSTNMYLKTEETLDKRQPDEKLAAVLLGAFHSLDLNLTPMYVKLDGFEHLADD